MNPCNESFPCNSYNDEECLNYTIVTDIDENVYYSQFYNTNDELSSSDTDDATDKLILPDGL